MAENKNIVIRLMADTASYEAAMTRAGSTAKTVASGMENTGRKSALITSGLTAAGLAAAAFGVASIKMAADFDQQMSTVQANTGATGAELDQLRQTAIEAGASTVYSASESADAINDLGKAGMSVTDILSGGLTGALNLAASDGMAVGDAAEYMANALSMFHLSGSQASQVADTLAAGAGKAVGNVSDFGEALNNCGAQANSFGMSIQETTGVLSLFAQNGTIGAEAGTQLNSMLMKLAAPSNDAAATMKELGISAYDASGNFVGMANFAGQLQKPRKPHAGTAQPGECDNFRQLRHQGRQLPLRRRRERRQELDQGGIRKRIRSRTGSGKEQQPQRRPRKPLRQHGIAHDLHRRRRARATAQTRPGA